MNYPKIDLITSDSSLNQLFKTYKIGFNIIDNKYELDIQVSIALNKENQIDVDILEIVCMSINGEEQGHESYVKLMSGINAMFGSEWYENIIKERAIADWNDIFNVQTVDEDVATSNMETILRDIEDAIDSFNFEEYLGLDYSEDRSRQLSVTSTIDSGGISTDLFVEIKDRIKNQ
jgi:hypothetical protein